VSESSIPRPDPLLLYRPGRTTRINGAIPLKASGGKRPHRAREYGSKALADSLARDLERRDREAERIGRFPWRELVSWRST
jgi:hypothetical protein